MSDTCRVIKFSYIFQHKETARFTDQRYTLQDIEHSLANKGSLSTYVENGWSLVTRRQFTSLLDKNGKEIYEGDILAERGNLNRIGEVRYEPNIASFMVFVEDGYCHLNEGDWNKGNHLQYTEVIGNIYEDPELLEVRG